MSPQVLVTYDDLGSPDKTQTFHSFMGRISRTIIVALDIDAVLIDTAWVSDVTMPHVSWLYFVFNIQPCQRPVETDACAANHFSEAIMMLHAALLAGNTANTVQNGKDYLREAFKDHLVLLIMHHESTAQRPPQRLQSVQLPPSVNPHCTCLMNTNDHP